MPPHWTVRDNCLEIAALPFYWRLTAAAATPISGIANRMPVRLRVNTEFDYLELALTPEEQAGLDLAYRQDANIGFVNPESGQIQTYGASVNNFFLDSVLAVRPRKIYEIGCGAGFSIMFMRERGWKVTGIDPSGYSQRWSERLGFSLINEFFDADALALDADFVFCNDVFEHVGDVVAFSRQVLKVLHSGGTFCFATTNSTESIASGDISMLEHQHVNMFSERSIRLILETAGFADIDIGKGSYGNTFQVRARKHAQTVRRSPPAAASCAGYLKRASRKIEAFARLYAELDGRCKSYVPLRCLPYLATVGDFGRNDLLDSNPSWRGKYIDGYARPIGSLDDVQAGDGDAFFVGSSTFFAAIRDSLIAKGVQAADIHGVHSLG